MFCDIKNEVPPHHIAEVHLTLDTPFGDISIIIYHKTGKKSIIRERGSR